jgi:hypothetical protein
MSRNVERVLGEIGQFPRQMSEAPRDGRKILGKSAKGLVVCYWDAKPSKMAGPLWVEAPDAERGYLDRYFTGWLDPTKLKLLDCAALAELLIAYIEDARSLSQTLSGWRVAANRAMLLRDEGSLQAHWLDGRRPDPVAGSA